MFEDSATSTYHCSKWCFFGLVDASPNLFFAIAETTRRLALTQHLLLPRALETNAARLQFAETLCWHAGHDEACVLLPKICASCVTNDEAPLGL